LEKAMDSSAYSVLDASEPLSRLSVTEAFSITACINLLLACETETLDPSRIAGTKEDGSNIDPSRIAGAREDGSTFIPKAIARLLA
jgi:hypothetical protein